MALFIIFAIIFVGLAGYGFYKTKQTVSSEMIELDFSKTVREILIFNGAASVAFAVMLIGGMFWGKFDADFVHYLKLIIGGLAFPMSLLTAIHFFIYFYWGKNIDEKWKKKIYWSFMGLFVAAFVFMWLFLDGYAPYLTYPIVNGINFSTGFVTPTGSKPNLAFYALCILSGAILVYFMCDHFFFKEYGKHGLIESTFLVAFPAGIIGARLWYCIGEGVPLADWIKIWNGGLTILGGATMGIAVGVAWFLWKNKKYSIWVAIDLIVPTILIAQAVGRFGNFFNCEVHGELVDEKLFWWLPEIIRKNMTYSDALNQFAPEGQIFMPLFFIEGVINFVGYFVLAHLFGKKLNKVTEQGDLCFAYIIWYGATRVILEPLRNSAYNMGENGYWSWFWSLIFVLGGTLAIIANHWIRYLIKKKKGNYIVQKGDDSLGLIESTVFGIVGLSLTVAGIVNMASNEFAQKIGFNGFNIGLMFLIVGVSILLFMSLSILRLKEARKAVTNNGN